MSDTDESALRDEWMKSFATPRKSTFSRDADGRYVNRFVEEDWQSYRRDNHPLAAAVPQQEAGEPVMWQVRFFDSSSSVTPGWGEWEEVVPRNAYTDTVETKLQELRSYIAAGYKYELRALYATPQPSPPQARVPLTEAGIQELWNEACKDSPTSPGWCRHIRFARAIERAHLIGLETKGDGNG